MLAKLYVNCVVMVTKCNTYFQLFVVNPFYRSFLSCLPYSYTTAVRKRLYFLSDMRKFFVPCRLLHLFRCNHLWNMWGVIFVFRSGNEYAGANIAFRRQSVSVGALQLLLFFLQISPVFVNCLTKQTIFQAFSSYDSFMNIPQLIRV